MEKSNEDSELLPTLPLEQVMFPMRLRLYQGDWIPEHLTAGVINAQRHFKARPTDVFLVSYPKSGTTWLKALAFAAMNRTHHTATDSHPFHSLSPHECLPRLESEALTLERLSKLNNGTGDDADGQPRLISTHLPLPLLPDSIKAAGCRLVYIWRDPKDVAISQWHFIKKMRIDDLTTTTTTTTTTAETAAVPFEKFIDMFCNGVCPFGPIWEHALGYWNESLRAPEKVLFLKYEEMQEDPMRSLLRIVEFMGCGFTEEEVALGVPAEVISLSSFDNLRAWAVKQNRELGSTKFKIKTESFFRKGVTGDWENYLTPEMARRMDRITRASGAGLALGRPGSQTTAMDV